jgi:hypothetical protein
MVLLKCATGEGWTKLMDELAINSSVKIERSGTNGTIYESCV